MTAPVHNTFQSVSFETLERYPREYVEFFRDSLAELVEPYKQFNRELGLDVDETILHLAQGGVRKAIIREHEQKDGVHPYTVRYAERGVQYIPKPGDINAGIPVGGYLDMLPASEIARHCSGVDKFLGRIGVLRNWTISGEFEKLGCKIDVVYPFPK